MEGVERDAGRSRSRYISAISALEIALRDALGTWWVVRASGTAKSESERGLALVGTQGGPLPPMCAMESVGVKTVAREH